MVQGSLASTSAIFLLLTCSKPYCFLFTLCNFFYRYLVQQKELQKDMQKHMAHLQQLKDYDERLAQEREELARHEQERKRIEVMRS